jgi:hypothetical protein
MVSHSSAEAVRLARQLLGLAPDEEGSAFLVHRLDDADSDYFLVHVGGQVACLNATTGALLTSAKTTRSPLTLTREAAIQRARSAEAEARLVWSPSPASRSMFDPLWALTESGRTIYVDQRGKVWNELPANRPGGGSA